MRKMRSLGWMLILLCTANYLLTAFAHQDSETLERKHDDSEHVMRKLAVPADEISLIGKGQKGKGATGGANDVHRPGEKSAAAATSFPPLFLSLSAAILLGFSFLP